MILFHDTGSIISLYQILNTGMLKSPSSLSITSSSEDTDFIFFSPGSDDYEFIFPTQVLVLDFNAVINKYKKFFINSSNLFGPTDGTQRNDKNCDCVTTFYSDELLQTEKNKLSSGEKPCLVSSLKQMIDEYVLTIPQNDKAYYNSNRHCEGGPEVGFYESNIELLGCLRSIRIKHITDYTSNKYVCENVKKNLNMSVEEVYEKIINLTHELGAEVIIFEPTKQNKGGKNLKKRTKKQRNKKRKTKFFSLKKINKHKQTKYKYK